MIRSPLGRLRTPLLLTAASLLVAGLALVVTGCSDSFAAPGIGSSAQTTDALAVLPADADVYGMTDVAAARENDALAAALGETGLGMVSGGGSDDVDLFIRMTGFDPNEDLDRLYIAASEGPRERSALVAYGRFDRDRIEQYVAAQAGAAFEVSEVEGIPVYIHQEDDGDRGGFALASDRMVLAGDEATLGAMIRRLGTSGQAPDAELQALFDRVVFPDGAWFVARGLEASAERGGAQSALAARATRGVAVSMDFAPDGVPVRAFLQTHPEADVEDVADVVRAGVAAARMGMKDQPSALDVLDRVEVEAEAEGVRVEAFLTRDFLAEAGAHHRGGSR